MTTLRATPLSFTVGATTTLAYVGSTGGDIRITRPDGTRYTLPTQTGSGEVMYTPTAAGAYRADLLNHRPPRKPLASATFAVQAAAPVTPPPTTEPPPVIVVPPPPAPEGPRRLPVPITSRTVSLPLSIDATGATEVLPALQAFFAQVPDGSIVSFPGSGTFKIATALKIWTRRHLVLEGHGSKLVAADRGADYGNGLISLYNSQDIAIREMGVVGGNPNPGQLMFGSEDRAHNININHDNGLPSRIELDRVWSTKSWGDFVQLGDDTWADGVWIHDGDVKDAGRSAWSILGARNVWIERNGIGNCGLQHHNIEPWRAAGGADNVHFLYNVSYGRFNYDVVSTGAFGFWLAMNGDPGASITNITVVGNTVMEQVMAVAVTVGRRRNLTFEGNTSKFKGTPLYGHPGVLSLRGVDGVTVLRNVQPLASGGFLSTIDCTNVVSDAA